jgi:hypothetical protein
VVGSALVFGLGVLTGGAGVAFTVAVIASGDWGNFLHWQALLLCVFFPGLGYVFFAVALRARVALEGRRISVRGLIREKSADIHEIVGYRIKVTRQATFWRIELQNGDTSQS